MEFERLIETERQNDELLRRAREDAAEIRRVAHDAAEARQGALAAELQAAIGEADRALDQRRTASLAEIAQLAAERAARYDAVSDDRLAALVTPLLDALLREATS